MNLGLGSTLLPGDPRLIDHIVGEVKSQGIFDQFRKECIADVDTKPAYQNLRTRVEGSVNSFLSKQRWRADLNKNQLRETLRKHISDAPYLDAGVERIVAQVVNPKIYSVFMPQVEDVVYKFLGLEKPRRETNGACGFKDLLPKDLDPVSPESDKNSLKDVSLDSVDANLTVPGEEEPEEELIIKEEPKEPEIKEEIKTEENSQSSGEFCTEKIKQEIGKSMDEPMDIEGNTPPPPPGVDDVIATVEKAADEGEEEDEEDEEDSPVFEPIDIMNLNESYISNDSHLSGISELTSHRSRSPDFSNEFSRDNFDFSNQDSQLSKVSSDSRLSIVTDFGYSNQPTTPISEAIKDDNSKEKFVKDNFKEIRNEGDKIIETKTIDINKQRDNVTDTKDSSDTRSSRTNLSLKESSRDGTESTRDKSEHREREKHRDTSKSKGSKERSDSRDSRSHKDRDKRKSNQSESKGENSDKSKVKEKSEVPKDVSDKSRESVESKESKDSTTKTKEEKPKESSGKEGKDLKDIYKEKIRELREKKELTEKEKISKDNKESKESSKDSKVLKDSKDKRESSKDKHRSSSSSSRNRSSSRHGSKSSRSSKDDGKTSRSESRDKSKRDDRRHSKDGKSKNQLESSEKSDNKKPSKSEKDEKLEIKQDAKSREKSSKKDSKSESHKNAEKSEKRNDSKDKKRKDEKKSKSKDDHSSLRKNSNDRRSSDRDGSSGSNGRSSHKSNSSSTASSKPSSTTLEKESSNTSNSSSETSDSIDESQTEDYIINEPEVKEKKIEIAVENVDELPDDNSNPKRIDLGPTEISLPLKKRPLQNDESILFNDDSTMKKPKFARNFEEAKKLMKLRKKLEKFKDQSSGDSRSPVSSEISEISEVPDDERVQIVAVKDDEEDMPYPEMECNFITEDTSKIILGDTELLSKEMITEPNTKSTLSEMELSIRQSLNEMISGKNLEDNAPQNFASSDPDSRPGISQEESSANCLDEPKTSASDDIPESMQPDIRDQAEEEHSTRQKVKENQPIEDREPKQSSSTEKFEATPPYSSPRNPQLSEDEEDCLYFLPDYERLNRFTQFLQSLEETETLVSETSSSLLQPLEISPRELTQPEISTMAPPQPKRKYSTSPLSDILLNNSNNNNDGPKIQETIYEEDGQTAVKKTKITRQKKQRPSVSSTSPKNLINGENFVMPLSPESDASVTSEKNQITQSTERNRPRGSNQRYTSDDLYKPRPLFASSSRRSRRSNPS